MPSASDFTKPIKISKSNMTFKCKKIALLLILLISVNMDALSYNGRTGILTYISKWYDLDTHILISRMKTWYLRFNSFFCVFQFSFRYIAKSNFQSSINANPTISRLFYYRLLSTTKVSDTS